MYLRKLQLTFAITIATKKCRFTHIERKAKKVIKIYDDYTNAAANNE